MAAPSKRRPSASEAGADADVLAVIPPEDAGRRHSRRGGAPLPPKGSWTASAGGSFRFLPFFGKVKTSSLVGGNKCSHGYFAKADWHDVTS